MAKTRLLQAVCTVAMLASVPAFAQSNTPPGDIRGAHESMAKHAGNLAPAEKMRSGPHDTMRAHRSAMEHKSRAMHERSDSSQNPAVDRLNEQSYQAAHGGRAFKAGDSGDMSARPGGMKRGMNDMSGGPMMRDQGAGGGSR